MGPDLHTGKYDLHLARRMAMELIGISRWAEGVFASFCDACSRVLGICLLEHLINGLFFLWALTWTHSFFLNKCELILLKQGFLEEQNMTLPLPWFMVYMGFSETGHSVSIILYLLYKL